MKNRIFLSVAASAILMFSSCGEKVYYAAQFGILPDSTIDAAPLMVKALEQIKRECGSRPVRLVLGKGNYDFHPENAAKREYYISNHDQDNPKSVAIALEDMDNFTLDGQGANIYTHGRMIPLSMVGCENSRVMNLSIDSRKPQISQAVVLANDTAKGEITYRLEKEVNYDLRDGRLVVWGEGWELTPAWGIAFDGKTRHLVYRTSDIGLGVKGLTEVEPYVMKAPWKDGRLVPGTVIAMRPYSRPTPGVFLYDCEDTRLTNVTVHYAEGMGLLAQVCEDIALDHFNVALREGTNRYFTTQADATHFSGCKGRISSVGGLYEGMMDDAINVHGTYLRVVERLDDHTVVGRYMHGQSYGFYWGGEGDEVQLVRSNTMEVAGGNRIERIEPYGEARAKSTVGLEGDLARFSGCKEFRIRFEKPVPADVADGNYGIENLEWTPEVYFADNVIRNNRARGTLFSTPRRTVVEHNLFDHTSGTAILLCGDCNGWYETGACREVIIRKNRFVNALTNMFQFTDGVISIYPEIPQLKEQKQYFHGGNGKGVVIEDNVFETFDQPLVYAKSLDGLTFRRNTVIQNHDFPPFHRNRHRFLFDRVVNVKIENNTFEHTDFDEERDVKHRF